MIHRFGEGVSPNAKTKVLRGPQRVRDKGTVFRPTKTDGEMKIVCEVEEEVR